MNKKLFFYELEGRGYSFHNKNWDEVKHGFKDDMLNMAWEMWSSGQAVKAQVPESNALLSAAVDAVKKLGSGDFVLVEKKNTEDWYLDDSEGMYWDHDGIDGSLCELDIGQVQAVEHKEYLITESNTLYAAKTWDDANDQVDCWQFFKTQEEAEKAAAYCKAKFNDEPIEAQEQKG